MGRAALRPQAKKPPADLRGPSMQQPKKNGGDRDCERAMKNGSHVKIEVNVKDIERGKKEDLAVHAGDIIIVPRRIF